MNWTWPVKPSAIVFTNLVIFYQMVHKTSEGSAYPSLTGCELPILGMKYVSFLFYQRQLWILDSKPWIPGSRYWIPDFFFSGILSLVGFWIPWAVFQISKPSISYSTNKTFPDSGIRIPLHKAIFSALRASLGKLPIRRRSFSPKDGKVCGGRGRGWVCWFHNWEYNFFMPILVSKGTEHWIVFCEVCNMMAWPCDLSSSFSIFQ